MATNGSSANIDSLADVVTGIFRAPREAVAEIHRELDSYSTAMMEREALLFEAIDQAQELTRETLPHLANVRAAIAKIHAAFDQLMNPKPVALPPPAKLTITEIVEEPSDP